MNNEVVTHSEKGITHPLSTILSYSESVRMTAPEWALATVALAVTGKLINCNQPLGVLRIFTKDGSARLRLDAGGKCLRNIGPVKTRLSDGELAFRLKWDGHRTVMETM
jgi:hypothetical protein